VNIVLAVIDILLLAAVIFLFVSPQRRGEEGAMVQTEPEAELAVEPEEPAEPEPAPEAEEPEAEPEPAEPADEPSEPEPEPETTGDRVVPGERAVRERHVVEAGDTFYDIAGTYWGDEHLWPDLYVLNRSDFPDPDLIRPGSTVEIYRSLAADGELSEGDIARLSEAYVETYRVYRRLGTEALERGRATDSRYLLTRARIRINKAHWLLYSGHRLNPRLAEQYASRIDDRDLRVVRSYLERFGRPDP
jgi:hypothetical protein